MRLTTNSKVLGIKCGESSLEELKCMKMLQFWVIVALLCGVHWVIYFSWTLGYIIMLCQNV